jgi:hypothetical protein
VAFASTDDTAHVSIGIRVAQRLQGSALFADLREASDFLRCEPAARPVMVMAFSVADGVITAIRMRTDPAGLGQVVPSWVQ